jgi:hypothetical protein
MPQIVDFAQRMRLAISFWLHPDETRKRTIVLSSACCLVLGDSIFAAMRVESLLMFIKKCSFA